MTQVKSKGSEETSKFISSLLLLPLFLGFSVPAIAHNESNSGDPEEDPNSQIICGACGCGFPDQT